MANSFVIYEAAMCCSSGVCGPNPAQSLIQLQDSIESIQASGATVERYSITGNPKKFRENPEVVKLIQKNQIKALPITTYNGKVFKVAGYPTLEEFKARLNTLVKGQVPLKLDLSPTDSCCSDLQTSLNEGCCSGQNFCDISRRPSSPKEQDYSPGRCC